MHDRFYSVLTGIYHLSVITCEYYAHNRIYSRQLQVLHAQQDSLASIQLLLVSTKVYDRNNVLASSFNSSAIARKQCASRVVRAQHTSYLQNFSSHKALLACFCKLGHELYRIQCCFKL